MVFDGSPVNGVNLHFEMGHTDALATAEGRGNTGLDTGDGQTAEKNWLSPGLGDRDIASLPTRLPGPFRPEPTEEHPIVVDRFEVSPEGHPFLASGHAAIVTLSCRSRISIQAGWGFSVCTADLATNIFSCGVGFNERSVTIRPGENEFRCRIPGLPLRPRTYAIRGGIADAAIPAASALRGFEESPDFFTVKAEQADRTTNWQSMMNDLIFTPLEWLSD